MYGPETRQRPPGYELFFAPLAAMFDPNTCEQISFAYISSKYGHDKQVREDGSRFFDHPKAAAWIYINELGGRDPRTICIILLHDIQEDTYLLSPYRMGLNFGLEIALDVRAVTKLPKGKESTETYLARIIARGHQAITAKLCDRLHNVRTLNACPMEKRIRYVDETKKYYLALLIPALRKCGKQWTKHADALETKINNALSRVILSESSETE